LFAGDQLAAFLDEEDEQLHGLPFQLQALAAEAQFVAGNINAEPAGLSLQRHGQPVYPLCNAERFAVVSIRYGNHRKVTQKSCGLDCGVRPGRERLSLIAGQNPRRSRAALLFEENRASGGRYVAQIVSLPAGSTAVLRRARPRRRATP